MTNLDSLVGMGFSRQTAAEALRQSNNSMDRSLQVSCLYIYMMFYLFDTVCVSVCLVSNCLSFIKKIVA